VKRPADSPSRRFHWRARDKVKLRRWERDLWRLLWGRNREVCLWASVLCDGLRMIYRNRSRTVVQRELAWLTAPAGDFLGDFENLCNAIDLEPLDIRTDVLADMRAGRGLVKLEAA
jgi:hypothetical protein